MTKTSSPGRAGDLAFTGAVPEMYQRCMVPLIFEPYAADLARRAAASKPRRVLEVAAGTGVVTRRLAAALGPESTIVATDLNPAMLEQAAALGTDAPVEWRTADALALPFEDGSFDLVTCVQSFHYMDDPGHAVREIARVLRPGGSALVSSVVGFEYDRRNFEARYTEHELRALFGDWDDVRVREDGGRVVSWTVLTGSLVHGLEQRVTASTAGRILRPAFLASYALVNATGLALRGFERDDTSALPMNLTLTARKPDLA